MALLPADPKGRKQALFLMLVVVVAVWWAVRTMVFAPRADEIAITQQQVDELSLSNRRARTAIARRDDLQARMAMMERQLRIFEEFIPESEEVPELLDAISHEATLTGIEQTRIRPQAAEAGEFYTKQMWELTVLGEYHDIGRYLARIASLPRIIKPANVQLSVAPASRATRDMEAPLEVSFIIETYVLGATPTTPVNQGASSRG